MYPTILLLLALLLLACTATVLAQETRGQIVVADDLPFERRVCRIDIDPIRPGAANAALMKKHRDRTKWYVPKRPFDGLSPEQYVDILAEIGAEVVFVPTDRYAGEGVTFKSEMVRPMDGVDLEHLPRMTARAREHGMMVLAYLHLCGETSAGAYDAQQKMQDWATHPIEDGRGIKPDWSYPSYLSPYRQWMGQFIGEYLRVPQVDGVWYDGTPFGTRNAGPWPAGDVGPYGCQAYLEDTGNQPPAKVDWDSQDFKEWVNWRYDKMVEFLDDLAATAAQENPDAVVALNYYARPEEGLQWNIGQPLRRLDGHQWVAQNEVESSFLDKVTRALSPRAYPWVRSANQWNIRQLSWATPPYFDPDQTIAKCLRSVAHGLAPCVSVGDDIETFKDSVKAVFDQLKKRRPYMDGDPVKYAAVLVSQQTRDFGDYWTMWYYSEGMVKIQNAEHLLTDVIFDDSLTLERLRPYPVVILPSVCLSDAQCEALRQYVRDGGTLIATLETSLRDEWGNPRDNFALADLFGVDYLEAPSGNTQIYVPQTDDLKKQFDRFISFVGASASVRLSEHSTAEILFTKSQRDHFDGLSSLVEEYDSDVPAVVRNRVGKGTVIYIAADMAQTYLRGLPLPRTARFLGALERSAAQPPIEFDAPGLIEVTALQPAENQIVIHLINTSALRVHTMAPLADIGITVHQGKVKRATLPLSRTELEVKNNQLTVPVVRHGEVVVLEME